MSMLKIVDQACCAPLSDAAMSEAESIDLARVFKALSDPVRLRLLDLIASCDGGEACVCDLTGSCVSGQFRFPTDGQLAGSYLAAVFTLCGRCGLSAGC
jgi:hypothetical protein